MANNQTKASAPQGPSQTPPVELDQEQSQTPPAESETQQAEQGEKLQEEQVDIAGTVFVKRFTDSGTCELDLIREPEIEAEVVKSAIEQFARR